MLTCVTKNIIYSVGILKIKERGQNDLALALILFIIHLYKVTRFALMYLLNSLIAVLLFIYTF